MLCYWPANCNSYVESFNVTAQPLTASITIQPSQHLITTRSSQISCAAWVHSLTETQLSPKARKSKPRRRRRCRCLQGRVPSAASSSTARSSLIPLTNDVLTALTLSLSFMHDECAEDARHAHFCPVREDILNVDDCVRGDCMRLYCSLLTDQTVA